MLLIRFIVLCLCIFYTQMTFASFDIETNNGKAFFPSFEYRQDALASLKAHIHSDNKEIHPYIKTGIFFPKGALRPNENIIAVDMNNRSYTAQLDIFNKYDDGSVRFGVIVIALKKSSSQTLNLNIKKSFSQKNPTIRSYQRPDIIVEIIDKNGKKGIANLRKAMQEKTVWQSGSLLQSQKYHSKVFSGLHIDFHIDHYENNNIRADIIFHYDHLLETPMYDKVYDVNIIVNGKLFRSLSNIKHAHHTKWRYPLRFGFHQDNSSLLDMRALMEIGAIPTFDLTYGTSIDTIKNNFQKTQSSNPLNMQSSGLLTKYMPMTGGRDEIGIFPQWAVRYIMSGHPMARSVTLAHGEIAAYIPWHYYDSETLTPALPYNYPNIWIDERATKNKHGIPPLKYTSDWRIDVAHQPSLTYLPFIITGDRYYYDTLNALFMFNRLSYDPAYTKNGRFRDPLLEQIRSNGWFRRSSAEIQSILHENADPSAFYIKSQTKRDMNFLYEQFVQGKVFGSPDKTIRNNSKLAGELTGMLVGYDGPENSNFMQDLAALGIGFEAAMNITPWLNSFATWQSQFIAGRFLQINNGYPPQMGAAYKFYQFVPDQNGYPLLQGRFKILNKWRDVFNYSVQSYPEFNTEWQKVKNGTNALPWYPYSASAYTAYARASNAQLFNITRRPATIEAYGFLSQYFNMAADNYAIEPGFLITPRFNDKMPLAAHNIHIGDSGDDDFTNMPNYKLIHGGSGNDRLILSTNATQSFMFGGHGNDILKAGSGSQYGSYMFGGNGNDVLISGSGNDILKGDEMNGRDQDIFLFKRNFGHDTILDFNAKYDKIHFCGFNNFNPLSLIKNKKYGTKKLILSNNETILVHSKTPTTLTMKSFIFDRCDSF